MVWSVTDLVIEDPHARESQFRDMRDAGFGGVAAFVRCSRYSWDDPPAHRALLHISRLCRRAGMLFWFGPDPRFVSHKLAGASNGLELLLFGNSTRADVWPNLADIGEGRFTVRCMLSPRHVHTLTDVAIEYHPIGLARVYAVRISGAGDAVTGIRDISKDARLFYNARDGYVEAFGKTSVPAGENWKALAFFHVRSSHFDFSNDRQLASYEAMLSRLKRTGCALDGIMWDEPGYTCTYGSLPYSQRIQSRYAASAGRPLLPDLWKLALNAQNNSHVRIRQAYYGAVQSSITRAEQRLNIVARRLWGPSTAVGIHDTWHFESGDMCDMNHGSMDLWQTVGTKTGGFVDFGGIQQLKDPDSPWHANHAAMTVTAASLGRLSTGQCAYNNLWTVGDDNGDGSQKQAMDFCVSIMALFGIRWLAHAYGPVGTIGQERTFLGSPPLPGYPDHSTWKEFPAWNRFLNGALARVNDRLPLANLLLLFPVESMYALGGRRADTAAGRIFSLVLRLLDRHYHVDLVSSTSLNRAQWLRKQFRNNGKSYDAVIVPFPSILPADTLRRIQRGSGRVIFAFEPSPVASKGPGKPGGGPETVQEIEDVLQRLDPVSVLRPVRCPGGTWVTVTPAEKGHIVSLAPARCGGRFAGAVRFDGREVQVGETGGLVRILFPRSGEPSVLSH
jgi:hypothetical protein